MAVAAALAGWVLWPRRAPSVPPPPPVLLDLGSVASAVDAGAVRLEGHVADGAGHPLPGARVEVQLGAGEKLAEAAGELGILRGPIPYPPATPLVFGPTTLCDAAGRFALAVPAGKWMVIVSLPGFQHSRLEWTGAPLEVVLQPAPPEPETSVAEGGQEKLAGVVVDERGFPVAGARIEVAGRGAISDRGGRFEVVGLAEGPYRVRVTHADFAPTEATLPDGSEVQLQLMPGGGISGDVRDPRSGVAPAGATLAAVVDGREQAVPLGQGGVFEVTGLRAGRVALVVKAPGYATNRREVDVPAGDRPRDVTVRDVAIELQRGGIVVGSVRAESGEKVAGANVFAGQVRGKSDARGEFRLDGVVPGRVSVTAGEGGRQAREEVEVRSDEESRVELTLR